MAVLLLALGASGFGTRVSPLHGVSLLHRHLPLSLLVQDEKDEKIAASPVLPESSVMPESPSPYSKLISPTAAGDAVALLLFAAIGRGNHNSDGGSALTTAAPFLLTWSLVAPLMNAYMSPDSRTAAILAPLPAIAVSVPLGCALRGILQGYQPPLPFWIVALIATTVLIELWRVAFYSLDNALSQFANAIVGATLCMHLHLVDAAHGSSLPSATILLLWICLPLICPG